MNMRSKCLPFPRGSTFSDGELVTLSATLYDHLEGKVFETEDTEHGTGQSVFLRIVRNLTGGDITVANDFCEFSVTTAKDYGRKISLFGADVSAAGVVAKPLDDAYDITTIPENDLFYVVEAGPCKVREPAGNGGSFSAGEAVITDANGRVDGAAAAGEYVVGTADDDAAGANEEALIYVNPGIAPYPAAG